MSFYQTPFLYENTRSGYDFIGEGPAMLFKPRRFKAITGGRLTVTNRDDTYLIAQFTLAGFPPKEWIVPPIKTRPDHHTIRGDYLAGVDCFGRGVIPNPSNLIHQPAMLAGYLHGWIIGYELPIKHWRRERLRWIKRTRSCQDN
jgi:hypothetical protein